MPFCHEWSEAKAIPREIVKRAAELGLLNAVSGAAKNPKNAALMKYPLPSGLKPEEFDIFHEFVCVDEIARCGSGGFIWVNICFSIVKWICIHCFCRLFLVV